MDAPYLVQSQAEIVLCPEHPPMSLVRLESRICLSSAFYVYGYAPQLPAENYVITSIHKLASFFSLFRSFAFGQRKGSTGSTMFFILRCCCCFCLSCVIGVGVGVGVAFPVPGRGSDMIRRTFFLSRGKCGNLMMLLLLWSCSNLSSLRCFCMSSCNYVM